MSQIIPSTSLWQQLPCVFSERTIKTLCAQLRFPVFLDSQQAQSGGRYSLFSAEPIAHLLLAEKHSSKPDKQHSLESFRAFAGTHKAQSIPANYTELPFVCGLLAYCSYGFGEASLDLSSSKNIDFPDAFIGHYTWSYVYDHLQQTGYLTFSPLCELELRNKILSILAQTDSQVQAQHSSQTSLGWQKSQSYADYAFAFKRVQDYILAGDCYQVNLTQRFESDLSACHEGFQAIDFYLKKQSELQTPYSAFMSFSREHKLLSFSPEQFIHIKNRIIESRPIKGTIANTADPSNIERLQGSLKNQAENVMIVDLLRNDLSKVCEVNSVHVPALFKIESYKNVHHMVSHIRGRLRDDISELDAFLSCFPGGSITGAPKVRAMEIIRELEIHDRSAYCGSVLYWNDNGHFDSNILIRSIVQSGDTLYCWAGGGIVADSELDDEYAESLMKVANLTGIMK